MQSFSIKHLDLKLIQSSMNAMTMTMRGYGAKTMKRRGRKRRIGGRGEEENEKFASNQLSF